MLNRSVNMLGDSPSAQDRPSIGYSVDGHALPLPPPLHPTQQLQPTQQMTQIINRGGGSAFYDESPMMREAVGGSGGGGSRRGSHGSHSSINALSRHSNQNLSQHLVPVVRTPSSPREAQRLDPQGPALRNQQQVRVRFHIIRNARI